MKILVANLGSTSFKYRLFDMRDERQLARGGTERIGAKAADGVADRDDKESAARSFVQIGNYSAETFGHIADHAEAVRECLAQLTDRDHGCLGDAAEVAAIGFKAVHGGRIGGVQRVTPDVLSAMEEVAAVAPAHNPPYITAMRLLREKLPEIPLVAAFETAFHETIPPRLAHYAIPYDWAKRHHVRRHGFHGASHRYIAVRTAEILGRDDLRIISCHLGGSSSLCAIRAGKSVANSLGMSPQSGIPHNNRVGDFDPFALPVLIRQTGKSLDAVLSDLAERGGLLGISGGSGDVRDLEQAAAAGGPESDRARLALDVFTTAVRHYLGAYLVELGGADAIVFTGGIGENGKNIRRTVCAGLDAFGIRLDPAANETANGETPIHAAESNTEIWVVPTNEEIIVARQAKCLIENM